MQTDYIFMLFFLGLTFLFGSYLILSKRPTSKLPRIPFGLFVFYFLLKTFVPIFQHNDLGNVASSLETAAAIVVWMAIIRIIVYIIVDFFLRQKKGISIPTITRDFALAVAYIVIAMIILKHKTNINLGSLLATSAVLTFIVGFALQDTLGNLFSGLALQLEHPYQIGDWIGFESMIGKVVGITWKSTKILTRTEEMIFVPNNTIAKAVLKNFSRPTPKHTAFIEIGTSYDDPPHKVRQAIVSVIKDHPKVVGEPEVRVVEYGDFSINYKAIFATEDFADEDRTKSEMLNAIWYRFRRDGIKIPYPIQEEWTRNITYILEEERKKKEKEAVKVLDVLKKIDMFSGLPDDVLKDLAGRIAILQFATGENIVKQGDKTGPMYIIKEGACGIIVSHADSLPSEVAQLGEMQIFGEMSVLTGAPRTATVRAIKDVVCYEIEKEDLQIMFSAFPASLAKVGEVLIQRRESLAAHKSRTESAMQAIAEKENQLVSKIKTFLGL